MSLTVLLRAAAMSPSMRKTLLSQRGDTTDQHDIVETISSYRPTNRNFGKARVAQAHIQFGPLICIAIEMPYCNIETFAPSPGFIPFAFVLGLLVEFDFAQPVCQFARNGDQFLNIG